jgi:flagellar capping protein FliD
LTKQSGSIDTQIADMERHILDHQQQLTDGFVAMESAQAKINQQLQYLTQNFK